MLSSWAGRCTSTHASGPARRSRWPHRPLALLVDRLIDEREVVVKPLGPLLEKQRRFSGAIQLGDGRLVLLLNTIALAQAARGMALVTTIVKHDAGRRHSRLLVVDD